MKKGMLLIVFLSFFITEIFAQHENTPMLASHPKIELGFQGLGYAYDYNWETGGLYIAFGVKFGLIF